MRNMNDYNEKVWDSVLDFAYPTEQSMTRKQVSTELRNAGIDMRPAQKKLQGLLQRARASEIAVESLGVARENRKSILQKLDGLSLRDRSGMLITTLKETINRNFSGADQAAFARKLEDASSENDLISLLEDMDRLDAFSESEEDGE